MIKTSQTDRVKPGGDLLGIKTGVLRKTTTEQFISKQYPQTKTVYFQGPTGTAKAVRAVASDRIDLFANDGILSVGEVVNQNLNPNDYALVPKIPLTCDYYGIVLPDNDLQWRDRINSFLRQQNSQQVWDRWFIKLFPYVLLNLDYCLNN